LGYEQALELQRNLARDRISGTIPQDLLLLVEHPPVVTLGRSSKQKHLVASPEFLQSKGVELFEVERGGDVTFHGPGQLVGYPIIDLKRHRQDLHWYLRKIEEALINSLDDYGIPGERNTAYTGVWTRGKKIASIGVHARDWVTWHGFALNVTTDLSYFDLIVPCGIDGVVMTSIARELGSDDISMQDVRDRVTARFAAAFDLTPVVTSRSTLLESVA
jgi:lipoate-protein ligase B